MAAAALAPVTETAQGALKTAKAEGEKIGKDPIGYLASLSLKIGVGLTLAGALMWIAGKYIQTAAKAADADARQRLGAIVGSFANVNFGPASGGLVSSKLVTFSANGGMIANAYVDPTQNLNFIGGNLSQLEAFAYVYPFGTNPTSFSAGITDSSGTVWQAQHIPTSPAGKNPSDAVSRINVPRDGTKYLVQVILSTGVGIVQGMWVEDDIMFNGVLVSFGVATNKAYILDPQFNLMDVTWNGVSSSIPERASLEGSQKLTGGTYIPVVSDIYGWLSGVATAASDLPKAILAALTGIPFLLADSVAWAAGQTLGVLFAYAGPILLFAGIGVLALSAFLSMFGKRLAARLELGANARAARFWNRFDRWYKSRRKVQEVWTQKATEGMIWSANEKPVFEAPVQGTPEYEKEISELTPEGVKGKLEKGQVTPKKSAPSTPPGGIEGGRPPEPEGSKPKGGPGGPLNVPPSEPAPPPPGPENSPAPPPPGPDNSPVPPPPDAPAAVPVVGPSSDKQEKPAPTPTSEVQEELGQSPNLREQKMALGRPREPTREELSGMAGQKFDFNPEVRARKDVPGRKRLEPTPEELMRLADSIDGSDPNREAQYREAAVVQKDRIRERELARGQRAAERHKASRTNKSRSMGYVIAMGGDEQYEPA